MDVLSPPTGRAAAASSTGSGASSGSQATIPMAMAQRRTASPHGSLDTSTGHQRPAATAAGSAAAHSR